MLYRIKVAAMLSPDDRLLIEIILGLGISQTALLLRMVFKLGQVESEAQALRFRIETIEKRLNK